MPPTVSAVIPMDPSRPFRILQLTDFHTDASEEATQRTFVAVEQMVAATCPDLLMVTGDLWCSDDRPDLAPVMMNRDLAFLGDLDVPWCFTWGNHDYCTSLAEGQRRIARTPGAVWAVGNGHGGYRVSLVAEGDPCPRWEIYVANSGEGWQLPRDLDWIVEDARALRSERGMDIPAVAFFHIPLGAYQVAMDEGRAVGVALETVLCSGDEANLGAQWIKDAGSIRACFCGHNHRNDFSFEDGGITFAFGRSTGYGGYGEDVAKGGKLITLTPDGTVGFETIFPPA